MYHKYKQHLANHASKVRYDGWWVIGAVVVDLVTNSYFRAVFSCPCVTHAPHSVPVSFFTSSQFLGNEYFVFLHRVLDRDEAEFLRPGRGLDGQPPGGDGHGLHRWAGGGGGHVGDDGHRGPDTRHRGVGQAQGRQAAQRVKVVNLKRVQNCY